MLRICRVEGCGQRVDSPSKVNVGGGLRVRAICGAGHSVSWQSCEFYNEVKYTWTVITKDKLHQCNGAMASC
jgi:hypothetical protein